MRESDMYVLSQDCDGMWIAEDFSNPRKIGKSEKWREAIERMESDN